MSFILVGLDGSETSRAAFAEAIREAAWREAGVVALHVVSLPVSMGVEYGVMIDVDQLRDDGRSFVADELATLAESYGGEFPVPVEAKVVLGHTGVKLIEVAQDGEDGSAELVVLGSRGLGGFKGLLLGSVTTYAVHHLTCRLLVVPTIPFVT